MNVIDSSSGGQSAGFATDTQPPPRARSSNVYIAKLPHTNSHISITVPKPRIFNYRVPFLGTNNTRNFLIFNRGTPQTPDCVDPLHFSSSKYHTQCDTVCCWKTKGGLLRQGKVGWYWLRQCSPDRHNPPTRRGLTRHSAISITRKSNTKLFSCLLLFFRRSTEAHLAHWVSLVVHVEIYQNFLHHEATG